MNILKYFFSIAPGQSFSYYIHFLVFVGILIIGSMIFSLIYNKKKKVDFAFKRLFKKLSIKFLSLGIIFLILIAARYENIPYFSMRIWLYIGLIFLLYFAVKYIKILFIDYPREKQNIQINTAQSPKEEKIYLPNKNKKH